MRNMLHRSYLCRHAFYVLTAIALAIAPVASSVVTAAVDGPLIEVEELAKLIDQQPPSLVLIDVNDAAEYAKQHLPGAQHVDINAWRAKSMEAAGLTSSEYWVAQLSALGISADSKVVVVSGPTTDAARAWWLLQYLGVEKSYLLNGGAPNWTAAGYELTSAVSKVRPSKAEVHFQPKLLATLSYVTDADSKSQCAIVDTRSEAEFVGERVSGPRGGHIPGAVHLEWTNFVDADGKYLPVDQLVEVFKKAGVMLDQPLVTHCQTGGRASVVAFAAKLAGASEVKNYYLGWSEYSSAEGAPVEK